MRKGGIFTTEALMLMVAVVLVVGATTKILQRAIEGQAEKLAEKIDHKIEIPAMPKEKPIPSNPAEKPILGIHP